MVRLLSEVSVLKSSLMSFVDVVCASEVFMNFMVTIVTI